MIRRLPADVWGLIIKVLDNNSYRSLALVNQYATGMCRRFKAYMVLKYLRPLTEHGVGYRLLCATLFGRVHGVRHEENGDTITTRTYTHGILHGSAEGTGRVLRQMNYWYGKAHGMWIINMEYQTVCTEYHKGVPVREVVTYKSGLVETYKFEKQRIVAVSKENASCTRVKRSGSLVKTITYDAEGYKVSHLIRDRHGSIKAVSVGWSRGIKEGYRKVRV